MELNKPTQDDEQQALAFLSGLTDIFEDSALNPMLEQTINLFDGSTNTSAAVAETAGKSSPIAGSPAWPEGEEPWNRPIEADYSDDIDGTWPQTLNKTPRRRGSGRLRQAVRIVAFTAAVAVPSPIGSTPLITNAPVPGGHHATIPKPLVLELGDAIINSSERTRQAFDNKGISLPEQGTAFIGMGDTGSIPVQTDVDGRLLGTSTPIINADAGELQDLYGGPRRFGGLQISAYEAHEQMDPGRCEEVEVRMNQQDGIRVAQTSPAPGELSLTVQPNLLTVCNTGSEPVMRDAYNAIIVQVVPGQ